MKNLQANPATFTILPRRVTTSTRVPRTCAWIRTNIWRQGGTICFKSRKESSEKMFLFKLSGNSSGIFWPKRRVVLFVCFGCYGRPWLSSLTQAMTRGKKNSYSFWFSCISKFEHDKAGLLRNKLYFCWRVIATLTPKCYIASKSGFVKRLLQRVGSAGSARWP